MDKESLLHEEDYQGYKIKVYTDAQAPNPRTDNDNFGVMYCFHSRYSMGDEHEYDVQTFKEIHEAWLANDEAVSLPVYMYDHGSITVSNSPFSCPWDSGQLGVIVAMRDTVEKTYGAWDDATKEKALQILRSETETYDKFLRGAFVQVIIEGWDDETTRDWVQLCGCGAYESQEHAIQDAKDEIDSYTAEYFKFAIGRPVARYAKHVWECKLTPISSGRLSQFSKEVVAYSKSNPSDSYATLGMGNTPMAALCMAIKNQLPTNKANLN